MTPLPDEDWANPWGDEENRDGTRGEGDADDHVAGEDDAYMWDEDAFMSAVDSKNECVGGGMCVCVCSCV